MAPIGKFSGISTTDISNFDNILISSINKIDNIPLPVTSVTGDIVKVIKFYDFEEETFANQHNLNSWRPSTDMLGIQDHANAISWRNQLNPLSHYLGDNGLGVIQLISPDDGIPAVVSNRFTLPSSIFNTIGWCCDFNKTGTGMSYNTGPAGGATSPYNDDPPIPSSLNPDSGSTTSGNFYIYTETSQYDERDIFVTAFNLNNVTQEMDSAASHALKLKFMTHANGSGMGDLGVYLLSSVGFNTLDPVEGAPESVFENFPRMIEGDDTIELAFFDAATLTEQVQHTSPYTERVIDLNAIRQTELTFGNNKKNHWIFFVYGNHTSFQSDLAIDNLRIEEVIP